MNDLPMNGHPTDLDQVIAEIKSLATTSPRVREIETPSQTPFEQQAHDLLLRSIDQVASDWVHQLTRVRENSERVEELVLRRVSAGQGAHHCTVCAGQRRYGGGAAQRQRE